jgi:hypothetical protein
MPEKAFVWQAIVLGHLPSMKNGRKVVNNSRTGKRMVIKNDECRDFVTAFKWQVKPHNPALYYGPVKLIADIYFRNDRCDLDESLLMDCLHIGRGTHTGSGIIGDDNQIKEKHVRWHHDKKNPRVLVRIESLEGAELLPILTIGARQ